MFLVEQSLAGLRSCLRCFYTKHFVQHVQMSHVGEIPKGNIDVQVEKEHVSGQLWAARKGYKSRIKKKKNVRSRD